MTGRDAGVKIEVRPSRIVRTGTSAQIYSRVTVVSDGTTEVAVNWPVTAVWNARGKCWLYIDTIGMGARRMKIDSAIRMLEETK